MPDEAPVVDPAPAVDPKAEELSKWAAQQLKEDEKSQPDLAARLGPDLDKRDRQVLFAAGFPVSGEDVAH